MTSHSKNTANRKHAIWKRFKKMIPLLILLGIVAVVSVFATRPAVVEIVRPQEKAVTEAIAATGRVHGFIETSVGSQVSGVVEQLLVRQGSPVRRGQVIAYLNANVTRAQLSQAEQLVQTAEIEVARASRRPLPSEFARLKADTTQAVAVAQARLSAAEERLRELQAGARPEAIAQARAAVKQSEAAQRQAESQIAAAITQQEWSKRDVERYRKLFDEGAVSAADLDRSKTALENAERAVQTARDAREVTVSSVENAKAKLAELLAGTRKEQIEQAKADVQAARSTLEGARKSGAEQFRVLDSQPRQEDIAVARARVRDAVQSAQVAARRMKDAEVLAPMDGVITEVVVYPGGLAGANLPIVRMVRSGAREVRLNVDESHLGRLRIGQQCTVTTDSFLGKRADARLREIAPEVNSERGTVELRLDLMGSPEWLRPGQTVSASILIDGSSKRLVVPAPSMIVLGDQAHVFVVEGGKARKRIVIVGPATPEGLPILDGLTLTDRIVKEPLSLTDGQSVQVGSAGK